MQRNKVQVIYENICKLILLLLFYGLFAIMVGVYAIPAIKSANKDIKSVIRTDCLIIGYSAGIKTNVYDFHANTIITGKRKTIQHTTVYTIEVKYSNGYTDDIYIDGYQYAIDRDDAFASLKNYNYTTCYYNSKRPDKLKVTKAGAIEDYKASKSVAVAAIIFGVLILIPFTIVALVYLYTDIKYFKNQQTAPVDINLTSIGV